MIRALLFDFDGLIVDTETPSYASWQEVYREHGQELPLDRWAAIIGTTGGFEPLDYLEELHGPIDREAVRTRRREHELELLEIEELRPGILDYLEEARRRGLTTAIVSSSSREWVDRHLIRLEQAEHFDEIVTADRDPERSKPRRPSTSRRSTAWASQRTRRSPSRTRPTVSRLRRRRGSSRSPCRTE